MDALSLPSIKSMMKNRKRLQPYIRILSEAFASIPNGMCWSRPYQNLALEAPVAIQVFLTTVLPICHHFIFAYATCGNTPSFSNTLLSMHLLNRTDYAPAVAGA
jgi:hypothetical protein